MEIQTVSKACCSRPPVVLRGGYNYTPKGTYTTYNGLKTYQTGSPTATRGILYIYDIFGLYIQTLRGADILASSHPHTASTTSDDSGEYQVFMPVWFGDSPADIANYPPKTPPQFEYITAFMTGPANPSLTIPLIAPIIASIQAAHPEIESWGILGFCWGGKVAALMSGEAGLVDGKRLFKASAQAHPSLLDVKDAENMGTPHCVLPSNDEPPELMEAWNKALKEVSPKSYSETFTDQVHGWMASRADFENQHNFEEYLRGYRIMRAFFNEHL